VHEMWVKARWAKLKLGRREDRGEWGEMQGKEEGRHLGGVTQTLDGICQN
jgi:hypothetical protein